MSVPRKFDRAELVAFLRLLDARLTRPARIRLIGGAAIGLCHLPAHQTRDLDYAWADREVVAAIAELRAAEPDLVVTAQTGVYFAPYSYEARLQRLAIPGLAYLTVEVPERHDLAIMKAARGFDRDLDALCQMHALEPFDRSTLVSRFQETWVTGPERLGEEGADDAERMLARLRQRR
jgi:hypothetical protein